MQKKIGEFDRVVCISLRRREDRRTQLKKLCKSNGWPFKAIEFYDAIDGGSGKIPVGKNFKSGGGAWGCRQSWAAVLQEAMADGVERILVLEDDAMWRPDFAKEAALFFGDLPADWEVAFLGGQNMQAPTKVNDRVARVRNCQRTHAIAMQGDGIRFVYTQIANADYHIDHLLGPACGRNRRAYQATPFLIGQAATRSDISGRRDHARFWTRPANDFPLLWLNASPEVAALLSEYGIHYGFDLDEDGVDRGLSRTFPRKGFYAGGIESFVSTVSWEAASFLDSPGVATIWHPNADHEAYLQASRHLPERIKVTPQFDQLEPAIEWLRNEFGDTIRLRSDRRRMPILLVRSPGNVVAHLRENGLVHFGNWLDDKTRIDRGLLSAYRRPNPNLESWFRILDREAREQGLPVGVYHPKAVASDLESCGRPVVVIDAVTIDDAVQQVSSL